MSAPTVVRSGGISFCGLLTIVFIAAKLVGAISWSWWWVLAPLWIPWALVIVLATIWLLVLAVAKS